MAAFDPFLPLAATVVTQAMIAGKFLVGSFDAAKGKGPALERGEKPGLWEFAKGSTNSLFDLLFLPAGLSY